MVQKLSQGMKILLGKGAHGAEITFLSTNVYIATLAKGVRRRALNVNVDIVDSNVDVGIEVGVVGELTSAQETKKPKTAGSPKQCMVVVREFQGLENNVHQLDCDGLASTFIRALVTLDTVQHTV